MYWSTVGDRSTLLKQIVDHQLVPGSYLASGTGLALIIGHRESVDLDWFTSIDFDPVKLAKRLGEIGETQISEIQRGTFHGFINQLKITWLHYPFPLLDQHVRTSEMEGLVIGSLLDIGLMKLVAISQRGDRKDFIDLFTIALHGHNLDTLLSLLPKKFPGVKLNEYHIVKSLGYFEDAQREPWPNMVVTLDWEEVRSFFIEQQRILLGKMTGLAGERS